MLRNSFYTVNESKTDKENLTATIYFHPEHEIFQGHFPGQPVVPGVCMVQIVKEMMEEALGYKLLFRKGHQIKFLKLIVPDTAQVIMIHISWKEAEGIYTTQASFKDGDMALFKLNGEFVNNE